MTLAPWLFTQRDPNAIAFLERLQPPSLSHPLGTDENGRDIWARVVHGARPTLTAALSLIGLSLVAGSLAGLVIGASGRRSDEILMRVTEFFLAFPQIIWALAITSVMGRGLVNCVLALALTYWPFFTRIVYAEARRLKTSLFIDALECIGARAPRILFLHILPNCISPIIVRATIGMGFTILVAAVLGFLGMGATPPDPDWGLAIAESRAYLPEAWWFSTFPGLAIFLTVLGFNLLGDGLRDIVDPRLRRSR